MSTIKTNNAQIGQSVTATNNFVLYQPASPDGTVRLGNGNSGSVTDLITVGSTGNLTFTGTTETYTNSVTISAASTKTLTLNGGAGSNGLVIDASNNVGIGTTPGAKLDVAGSIRMPYGSGLNTLTYGGSGITMLYNTTWNSVGNIVVLQNPYSDIVFANATTGTATEKMRLNTNGALVLQNGNTAASGVGIAFPATQSASSDANTLDDYEEGTWTPVDNSGAGLTFTNVGAIYTKVGRVVTCSFNVTYPTTASASGASIAGFPYPTANISGLNNSSSGFTTYTDSGLTLTAPSGGGTSNMNIYNTSGTTVANSLLSGKSVRMMLIYVTAT